MADIERIAGMAMRSAEKQPDGARYRYLANYTSTGFRSYIS
jgi:hypothetical protein